MEVPAECFDTGNITTKVNEAVELAMKDKKLHTVSSDSLQKMSGDDGKNDKDGSKRFKLMEEEGLSEAVSYST